MALRFSAVKLTAQEQSCELLVGGVPTGYEDLTGWTAFDNFLKDKLRMCYQRLIFTMISRIYPLFVPLPVALSASKSVRTISTSIF